MNRVLLRGPRRSQATPRSSGPRRSYTRLAITDAMGALGLLSAACAVFGARDALADAVALGIVAALATTIGLAGRRTFTRLSRPSPGRILSGLAVVWAMLVLVGTAVYLVTGTTGRVDDALVESAAGFSTVAMTTLDPTELTTAMQLWRAGTQWLGGLLGILAAVVALPLALGRTSLAPRSLASGSDRLAPSPMVGRRRVLAVYGGFTAAVGLAYAAAGMGAVDSAAHALTTTSTGGMSTHADSFVSEGGPARVVATAAMAVAGCSYFVLWWALRGRRRRILRSLELRLYVGIVVATTAVLVGSVDELSVGDAAFTATSAASTTGFAVGDWTTAGGGALAVILIVVATGAMSGSAGGGLGTLRVWTLVSYARRELRRQLDPHAVIVVRQGEASADENALERITGYQIAHLGLIAVGAFGLAAAGTDLLGAIYTSVSATSTFGPGVGVGPFGDLGELDPGARLLLLPLMLAGRLSVLPVMLAAVSLVRFEGRSRQQTRRLIGRVRR